MTQHEAREGEVVEFCAGLRQPLVVIRHAHEARRPGEAALHPDFLGSGTSSQLAGGGLTTSNWMPRSAASATVFSPVCPWST